MKIKVSELRRLVKEVISEMKLGLNSEFRSSVSAVDDAPTIKPLGSPQEDIIDFQRDRDSDDREDFKLNVRKHFPKTVAFKTKLH